jgi:hypothetical protein
MTGSAARGIAKRLRRHDYDVGRSESYLVDDSEGPPADGEFARARAWGATLHAAVSRRPVEAAGRAGG